MARRRSADSGTGHAQPGEPAHGLAAAVLRLTCGSSPVIAESAESTDM